MNNRILIKAISELLLLTTFKPKCDGAGAVSLYSENKRIGIGYTKGVAGLRLPPQIAGYISFSDVESILEPYYKKHGLGYQPYTIHKSSRRFEHLSLIDLCTTKDIQKVSTELRIMVFEDILPFFEENNTLEKVHEHFLTLPDDQWSRYFVGALHLSVMAIKALLKSADFEKYSLETLDSYRRESFGQYKHVFAPIYAFLPELYDELKAIYFKNDQ